MHNICQVNIEYLLRHRVWNQTSQVSDAFDAFERFFIDQDIKLTHWVFYQSYLSKYSMVKLIKFLLYTNTLGNQVRTSKCKTWSKIRKSELNFSTYLLNMSRSTFSVTSGKTLPTQRAVKPSGFVGLKLKWKTHRISK